MNVHLAGYNIDTTVLNELLDKAGTRDDVTPEVLSAAYARISRDPRPIEEIRYDARREVEKARKSNAAIIFKMGHHSVAEHAVFNFDIVGVSRLAMEEIEKFRLCSFTEKSQRYITLDSDYVVPDEIVSTPLESKFRDTVRVQNETYNLLFDGLKQYLFQVYPDRATDPQQRRLLEGMAREDARYVTPLATAAQVGLTVNARNLELMLRRFASHPSTEIQKLGKALHDQVAAIAPSIILFHEANPFDRDTYPRLRDVVGNLFAKNKTDACESPVALEPVDVVSVTPDADEVIAAALVHTSTQRPYDECRALVAACSSEERAMLFQTVFESMHFYDAPPREFEYAHLTWAITLSAACFAQLKRHRMTTTTTQHYHPDCGTIIPQTILDAGLTNQFTRAITVSEELYFNLLKETPHIAPAILTNAHRKRILVGANARELYHISRLREDQHAQWDIRNIAGEMTRTARKVMPLACGLIGGKDRFDEVYGKMFGTGEAK